jgi:hypothetical protein
MIQVFEWAKIFHALDRAVIAIDLWIYYEEKTFVYGEKVDAYYFLKFKI